jgi:tetratricopeptide (TPR) repeat protein
VAHVSGQAYFEESQGIKEAYHLIIDLKLDEARIAVNELKTTEPDNLLRILLENYIDFFTVFINEEESQFNQLEKNKRKRLDYIEKYGDRNSPYYLYTQAEIDLQWSLVRAKFDQLFKAATEAYQAYKLLSANQEKHPHFIANKKSLSAIHVLVESIPKIARRVFRIKGSIAQGTKEIQEVMDYSKNNDFLYKEEATAVYTYILYYQNNRKEEAWNYLSQSDLKPEESPLVAFLMATFASKVGENEYAIKVLEDRPKGPDYSDFQYLDFMLGKAKLNRLDKDADVYFEKFIEEFRGQHYIKEAYQKLGWYNLAVENNNVPRYKSYMQQVQKYGQTLIDGDKQAEKEANSRKIPHAVLLKSRLLYDGGYYERAYNVMIKNSTYFNNNSTYNLEFNYRLGRITQSLGNSYDAINYYNQVINSGSKSKEYFACNSALQLGLIFEQQKNYKQAKRYFKMCLDMSPSDYKNSLHQKATSGLKRM